MVVDGSRVILIDTCILIRLSRGEPIPPPIRQVMQAEPWAISVMSAWEISIKHHLGKLPLEAPPERWWPATIARYRLEVLDFSEAAALVAGGLPKIHTDPFDRAIIATGVTRGLAVATVDQVFAGYSSAGLRLVG